jgi:hypothetical protein
MFCQEFIYPPSSRVSLLGRHESADIHLYDYDLYLGHAGMCRSCFKRTQAGADIETVQNEAKGAYTRA